ncbi:MAG: hypothetical protein ACRDBG_03870 [Waterburya sp.]
MTNSNETTTEELDISQSKVGDSVETDERSQSERPEREDGNYSGGSVEINGETFEDGDGSTIVGNGEVVGNSSISIGDASTNGNVRIAYTNEEGAETFSVERPQAELNIFDSQYYTSNNPDVAQGIEGKYQNASLNTNLQETQLPNVAPQGTNQIQTTGGGAVTIDGVTTTLVPSYTASIEHYVQSGATEGRDPSPLFDTQYYLKQNPDVATALAGGNFSGDPLLHYVSAGAAEGRDPNPYFDSDYYLEQNPEVQEAGWNPLEHYVLYGSASQLDPSPNFDPNYYLSQNPDVAQAGIDPLTHFLTSGQEEGRSPMAG